MAHTTPVILAELRDLNEHLSLFGPVPTTIPVSHRYECDHTETICDTAECVDSWSCDWDLLMEANDDGLAFVIRPPVRPTYTRYDGE